MRMSNGFEDQKAERPSSEDASAGHSSELRSTKLRVGPAGRVVIPAEIRSALNIKEGDVLLARLAGEELRLVTLDAAIGRAQAFVRHWVPEGTTLVDEFLGERRDLWAEDE
jgi:AbrB family looped-hinge helix DNA binding protein